jgi:hypothetical protein
MLPGSHVTPEQTRISEGLPKRIEARASASIFFIKTLVIDRILTYSDYRPAQAGAGSPPPAPR